MAFNTALSLNAKNFLHLHLSLMEYQHIISQSIQYAFLYRFQGKYKFYMYT